MDTNVGAFLSRVSGQYVAFAAISLVAFVLAGTAHVLDATAFRRFFGTLHPLLVVAAAGGVGLLLFTLLLSDGRVAVYRAGSGRGLLLSVALALPFGAAIILVDHRAVFPVDMNVPFPVSLAFYPAVAYVAEILFHVLPFTLIYLLWRGLGGGSAAGVTPWIAIVGAALVEALYQAAFSAGEEPAWAVAYVGVHLFLIAFVQLLLFYRYDFATMLLFRLAYYLIWHISWGHLRLSRLF